MQNVLGYYVRTYSLEDTFDHALYIYVICSRNDIGLQTAVYGYARPYAKLQPTPPHSCVF